MNIYHLALGMRKLSRNYYFLCRRLIITQENNTQYYVWLGLQIFVCMTFEFDAPSLFIGADVCYFQNIQFVTVSNGNKSLSIRLTPMLSLSKCVLAELQWR